MGVYFDGTAHSLGVSAALDIDAFAVPEPTVAQTISFAALAGKTFGDADFDVSSDGQLGSARQLRGNGQLHGRRHVGAPDRCRIVHRHRVAAG